MRNIKLADGTVYHVDRCGADNGTLAINIIEHQDIWELVDKFSVEENVSTIEHYFDGTETDHVFFRGYIYLVAAALTFTGVTVTLRNQPYPVPNAPNE